MCGLCVLIRWDNWCRVYLEENSSMWFISRSLLELAWYCCTTSWILFILIVKVFSFLFFSFWCFFYWVAICFSIWFQMYQKGANFVRIHCDCMINCCILCPDFQFFPHKLNCFRKHFFLEWWWGWGVRICWMQMSVAFASWVCCARPWQQPLWGIHQTGRDRCSRRYTQHDNYRESNQHNIYRGSTICLRPRGKGERFLLIQQSITSCSLRILEGY